MSAKWTIMVYMAADEVLANFAVNCLKQLKDNASSQIVVAAQLGIDPSMKPHMPVRYKFAHKSASKLSINDPRFLAKPQPEPKAPMTDWGTLCNFLEWAYRDCPAENYALVFWGHGPELCYQTPDDGKRRLYLKPQDLSKAIQKASLVRDSKKLDVIAMDACSMSTFEFAFELRDLAEFMIASQDEVSDLSLPYESIMAQLESNDSKDLRALCKMCVDDYINEYKDCFCNVQTGMRPPRLSILQLGDQGIGKVAKALAGLVQALQSSPSEEADNKIKSAREGSTGFVGGLFVDVADFCRKLQEKMPSVGTKCGDVIKAIDDFVIACEAAQTTPGDGPCHGISVYFPYQRDTEKKEIEDFNLLKGIGTSAGDVPGKDVVNSAARNVQRAARHALIQDFEEFYPDLAFAAETCWYGFIQDRWSRILARDDVHTLDLRYSAAQCCRNLLRQAKPCMSKRAVA